MDEMRRSLIQQMGSESRAWQANTELLTAISHDIRTPMTSMIGYLGLLNDSDFSDLEHLALKLLVRPQENNFLKTPEAIEISKKFQYIMVDEYQDTNEAQDMIFRAVSNNEENLFTVGDVKQSIYRFRQAMPEIFLRRKNSYDFYDKNLDNYPGKIILDKNFRSRFEILDFINFIFHQIMSKELGDMDYTKEEELHLGAQFNESNDNKISIQIINSTESFEDSKYFQVLIFEIK